MARSEPSAPLLSTQTPAAPWCQRSHNPCGDVLGLVGILGYFAMSIIMIVHGSRLTVDHTEAVLQAALFQCTRDPCVYPYQSRCLVWSNATRVVSEPESQFCAFLCNCTERLGCVSVCAQAWEALQDPVETQHNCTRGLCVMGLILLVPMCAALLFVACMALAQRRRR